MTGDILFDEEFSAADNNLAPGSVTIHALVIGANTIVVPLSTGMTIKGATIIPPVGNTAALTLKGVAGDTGIVISKTDPTSIAFEAAPVNFVLNTGAAINGLLIVWT